MSLYFIFVLSGFAGLVYQSVWSHYLGLMVGHAAYAQALVLAIYMGGMSWGAMLASRRSEQQIAPVKTYALIEAIIGLTALLFHTVFTSALAFSHDTLLPRAGEGTLSLLLPWIIATLLILPQSILLGMTFPLISAGILRARPLQGGSVLGALYFSNSIGAATGVLFTTFLLVPRWGLNGALLVAGALNLLVAVTAAMANRQIKVFDTTGTQQAHLRSPASNNATPSEHEPPNDQALDASALLRLVLAATCLSGAASFVYEIAWVRMIGLVAGSTLHAFELMLASFILGLALGGLWIRRRADRSRSVIRLVAVMQIAMGIAALLSLALYRYSFGWTADLMSALSPTAAGYHLFNAGTAVMSIIIMLPAAFFAGTTLPLFTVALLQRGLGENAIGRVYAWNSLGAILGVAIAIHVLIPLMGLHLSLLVAAFVDMLIGIVILRCVSTSDRQTAMALLALLVCAILVGTAARYGAVDPRLLSSGVFRSGKPTLDTRRELLFYKDGKTASVSVDTSTQDVAIATNGKVDAAISLIDGSPAPDEPTMVMLGALPLAYAQSPTQAAVIGFGSGLSTHTLLADPRLERVDTIEIEAAMLEGARAFGHRNERAYLDPRSHIIIDDAKSYFARNQRRYDIIVAEPSNPWIAGVGNLFTREFYEFIPRFLSADGIFVQWLQLYEINEELVGTVLSGLTPAFGDYNAYLSNTSDLIIVASNGTLPLPSLDRLFTGDLRRELNQAGFQHPADIRFRRIADARLLRTLSALYGQRTNSDYFPLLSLEAPQARFRRQSAAQITTLNVLDVPLLETLGAVEPLPVEHAVRSSYITPRLPYTEDMRLQRGLWSKAADDTGVSFKKTNVDTDTLKRVTVLRDLMSRCDRWTPTEEQLAVAMLLESIQMIAFLPATSLQGLFEHEMTAECPTPPPDFAHLLALAAAAGQRDHDRQVRLARTWLDDKDERTANYQVAAPWVFFNLQAGLIRLGRFDEIEASESRWGKEVPAEAQWGLARQIMLAWIWQANIETHTHAAE